MNKRWGNLGSLVYKIIRNWPVRGIWSLQIHSILTYRRHFQKILSKNIATKDTIQTSCGNPKKTAWSSFPGIISNRWRWSTDELYQNFLHFYSKQKKTKHIFLKRLRGSTSRGKMWFPLCLVISLDTAEYLAHCKPTETTRGKVWAEVSPSLGCCRKEGCCNITLCQGFTIQK